MTWSRPTVETIYQRVKADMESRVTAGVSIPRVAMLGIMSLVFAGGTHLVYGFIQWLSKQLFVDTASTFGLTRWGNILGLPQKAATYSSGQVSFNGVATTVVASGTKIVNSEGNEYETQSAFTIGTTVSVESVSLVEGEDYNTTDTTMQLSSPLPSVDSTVDVVSGFDDASNLETATDWVIRLLQRFQEPPASGTTGDNERWALKVSGVGKAWCFGAEDWDGAGTVGLAVSDSDLSQLSSGIVDDVEDYVESVKPIPAHTTYYSPTVEGVDYKIEITPLTADVQNSISAELETLFILESDPGGTVLLSHMNTAIGVGGPTDYTITEIKVDGNVVPIADISATDKLHILKFASATYSLKT